MEEFKAFAATTVGIMVIFICIIILSVSGAIAGWKLVGWIADTFPTSPIALWYWSVEDSEEIHRDGSSDTE